jgi:hypothetical protein
MEDRVKVGKKNGLERWENINDLPVSAEMRRRKN